MCRMPKTLLAVIAAGLLTGCNSYNRPTTQIGYWPDYEDQNSLNDSVLNARGESTIVTTSNAPVPGDGNSTYIAPAPQPIVQPTQPVQVIASTPAPAPATVYVTPGPVAQPIAPPVRPIILPHAAAPAPAPVGDGTYIVKRGDSLWLIAKKQYGSALRWKEIAAANPAINPKRLQVGQRLTLPNIGRNTPIRGAAAAARPATHNGVEDQAAFK